MMGLARTQPPVRSGCWTDLSCRRRAGCYDTLSNNSLDQLPPSYHRAAVDDECRGINALLSLGMLDHRIRVAGRRVSCNVLFSQGCSNSVHLSRSGCNHGIQRLDHPPPLVGRSSDSRRGRRLRGSLSRGHGQRWASSESSGAILPSPQDRFRLRWQSWDDMAGERV